MAGVYAMPCMHDKDRAAGQPCPWPGCCQGWPEASMGGYVRVKYTYRVPHEKGDGWGFGYKWELADAKNKT